MSTRADTELLRLVLDTLPMGVCASEPDGRVVLANQVLCEMLGCTLESLRADRPPYAHWPPEHQSELLEMFRAVRRGDATPRLVTFQRRDGSRFPCRVSGTPHTIGQSGLHLIIFEDRTQQTLHEDQLDNLRGLIQSMNEQGQLATWRWTPGEPTAVSESYLTMLGYPAASFVDPEWWGAHVHPDDLLGVSEAMRAVYADEANIFEAQFRMLDADGAWHWVLARGFVHGRARDGQPLGMWGTHVSIQRLKLQEERLQRMQNLDLLGQLSAGIAHDFNNVLAVLGLNLQLLGSIVPASEQGIIEDMSTSLARARSMVDTLMQHRRGRRRRKTELVAVGDFVAGSERLLRTPLHPECELHVRVDAPDARVRVDTGALENALLNLVLNARDAIATSGSRIELHVEYSSLPASGPGQEPVPAVAFRVRDDGPGMSRDLLGRATQPLFTTKPPGEGTGLGLTMVSRMVLDADGHLDMHSEPGVGTTVSLVLPAVDPPLVDTEVGPADIVGGDEVLVVVDDERGLLDVLHKQLSGLGYRVHTFDNPRAALGWLHDHPCALLLTDVYMPFTVGGIELARRANEQHPELKVLFMTAFAGDREAEARAFGDVLYKPFAVAELAAEIRRVLET